MRYLVSISEQKQRRYQGTARGTLLTAQSLMRGMAAAFYSKNGMIKEGVLAKWKDGIQPAKKGKSDGKGKRKVIVLED